MSVRVWVSEEMRSGGETAPDGGASFASEAVLMCVTKDALVSVHDHATESGGLLSWGELCPMLKRFQTSKIYGFFPSWGLFYIS